MNGFISWAFSADAANALFSSMPRNPMGEKYARAQMQQRFVGMFLRKMGYQAPEGQAA
jgi:hypothetical protein